MARCWPKKRVAGRRALGVHRISYPISYRSGKRSTRAIAELAVDRTLDLLHVDSGRALGPLLHAVFDAITFGQGVEAFPHNG
jgi:hypothetical protein